MSPGKIPDLKELVGVPDVDRNRRYRGAVVTPQITLPLHVRGPEGQGFQMSRAFLFRSAIDIFGAFPALVSERFLFFSGFRVVKLTL